MNEIDYLIKYSPLLSVIIINKIKNSKSYYLLIILSFQPHYKSYKCFSKSITVAEVHFFLLVLGIHSLYYPEGTLVISLVFKFLSDLPPEVVCCSCFVAGV